MEDDVFISALREHIPDGVNVDSAFIERCSAYQKYLVEYNEHVNLTAVTDERESAVKHFADSLMLLKYHDLCSGEKICDVGTGAGFPGVVLLCARPGLEVTLFDAAEKKLVFVRQLLDKLGLTAETVHIRAEDAGTDPQYRGQFDVVTARAVAQLRVLSEYCVPLVRTGGVFIPLKGSMSAEEKDYGVRAAKALGCSCQKIIDYELKDAGARSIAIFVKEKPTDRKFPRSSARIAKNPLPLN